MVYYPTCVSWQIGWPESVESEGEAKVEHHREQFRWLTQLSHESGFVWYCIVSVC